MEENGREVGREGERAETTQAYRVWSMHMGTRGTVTLALSDEGD